MNSRVIGCQLVSGVSAPPPMCVHTLAHETPVTLIIMPSPLKQKKPSVVATKTTRRRDTSVSGSAEARSKKVADEYAIGKRVIPQEDPDLPPNATPLDILMMAMKRAYLLGGSIAAAPYAEKAAPYMHGKISSIELKNPIGGGGSTGSGKPVPFRIEFVDPQEPPNDE